MTSANGDRANSHDGGSAARETMVMALASRLRITPEADADFGSCPAAEAQDGGCSIHPSVHAAVPSRQPGKPPDLGTATAATCTTERLRK